MDLVLVNKKVNSILNSLSEIILPIKIEDIVKSRGIKIMPYPLGEDVSGLLAIEGEKITIGYNQNESRVRKRFTIAHELGHFELHRNQSNLFVDKNFKLYRSQASANTTLSQKMEKEANAFAAALLMPEQLVKKEVDQIEIDLGNEEAIKKLSKIFDVSTTAMYFRITNLGFMEL